MPSPGGYAGFAYSGHLICKDKLLLEVLQRVRRDPVLMQTLSEQIYERLVQDLSWQRERIPGHRRQAQ